MGIIRKTTDLYLGSIATSKVLSLTSTEVIYQISSGNRAVEIVNQGAGLIFYGPSGLAVNSAGVYINTGGAGKFWDSVVDDFTMALRAPNNGTAIIHEYGGNSNT